MQLNMVEKMARDGDTAFFLFSSGDKTKVKIMDIEHATHPNGTHRGMYIHGHLVPTTITEMELVNIWKNMLQGK